MIDQRGFLDRDFAIARYAHDANGNRQAETGSAASTYAVSSTNNQITANYNNAGRLATLAIGSTTKTSIYNPLGQRMKVSGGAGTSLYAYDEAGHLFGEYDGSGTPIEETVWLGDIPVATLRPSGATVVIDYVQTDHLNTPRQVTRPSDNSQLWTWYSDPFGTDAANPNPGGAGTFPYNLRFPGQVFDGQAGLHQNYFRDYDPATGKYWESDPFGLKAGVNTYAYVRDNPEAYNDPTGLQDSGWECKAFRTEDACLARVEGKCGCKDAAHARRYGAEDGIAQHCD